MGPRVLLVGGPGGAGSSTTAALLADHLAGAGRGVTVLDSDAYDGAGARCTDSSVQRVEAARRTGPDAVSSLLEALGDSADLVDAVRDTHTARAVQLLWSVPLDADPEHTVVIDAGSTAPEVARLARTLPTTMLRLSRLGSGWLRTARPLLAAVGGRRSGPALLAQLQAGSHRARAIRNAVCGGTGGALLVAGDDGKTARIGVGIGLSGVRVRGVVGLDETTEQALPGVQRLDTATELLSTEWKTALPLWINADTANEGYRMRMPLPLKDFRDLKLRWAGHSLTLSACGHRSVLELPSALQRCRPSGAQLRDGMLEVVFRPIEAGA